MPKRKAVRRIKSEEVQGEDSWVEMRRPKGRDIKNAVRKQDDNDEDKKGSGLRSYKNNMALLRDHVLSWNWVDDDGAPLAQPQAESEVNVDVFDELTDEEVKFLSEHLTENENSKN